MAVPKRRQSNARTGSRRAHDALRPRQLDYCRQCSRPVPSHVVCPNCGYYMGRKAVEVETRSASKKRS
ncbi:MAG: 50S ribosomal protein L32 [Thermoguttaceae bacterium]